MFIFIILMSWFRRLNCCQSIGYVKTRAILSDTRAKRAADRSLSLEKFNQVINNLLPTHIMVAELSACFPALFFRANIRYINNKA